MTEHSFTLVPFPDLDVPEIRIAGRISREHNLLRVQYSLSGNIEDILFPEVVSQSDRRDNLWKETCFEFFLAIPGQPQYWEFNLSAGRDWNAYHMDAYRRVGFREEQSIQQLQFEVRSDAQCFSVDSVLDLSPIIGSGMHIQAGVTSVIQSRDGHETYWALAHPSRQADFHLRESFILALEGSNYP
jgi:hypothetical protein